VSHSDYGGRENVLEAIKRVRTVTGSSEKNDRSRQQVSQKIFSKEICPHIRKTADSEIAKC